MEEPERLSDDLIHGFVDYLSFNGKTFNWQDEASDVGRKRLEAHDQVDFAIFLDEAAARDAIPRIVALLDDNVLGEFGSGLLSDWIHGDPANRLPWLADVATRDSRLGVASPGICCSSAQMTSNTISSQIADHHHSLGSCARLG